MFIKPHSTLKGNKSANFNGVLKGEYNFALRLKGDSIEMEFTEGNKLSGVSDCPGSDRREAV